MAQDSIMGNLFGVSPEIYEQNRQEQTRKQALEFAQLDPYERTNALAFIGGRGLGNIVGGAIGAQDPVMRMMSQRAELGQQFDLSTPTGFKSLAKELLSKNDPQGAQIALQKGSELELRESQITKNLRERAGADPLQQLIRAGKYTPESIAEYAKTDDVSRLVTIEKTNRENIKEVGVAAGSREAVYLDVNNDQQFVYQKGADGKQIRVPYFGGIDRVTSSTKVEAEKKQTEFEKILDKKDAERVDGAMTLRDNSIASLNSLERLNKLDQSALISGAFAANRVGLTNLLNTLGLTSPKDRDDLAKSENYQKTAGDVILATLGGRLGSGFSNADREFIQSLVPQLNNSPQARKQLIEFMVKKNQTIVNEATRLENYARDKKTLKGFVPTIPLISGQPAPANALQSMSTEQLQQMLKNAK
jgi:hypothetical protein